MCPVRRTVGISGSAQNLYGHSIVPSAHVGIIIAKHTGKVKVFVQFLRNFILLQTKAKAAHPEMQLLYNPVQSITVP